MRKGLHVVAIVYSRALTGIQAPLVIIEVHLSNGLPSLSIVGLPEAAVKESKDRVRSALINSHFEFPLRRITVNLAPADLPKQGGHYDLPIALGLLAASKQIATERLTDYEFIGELALTGELRTVSGTLPVAISARNASRALIVPCDNAREAALVRGASILPAEHLLEVCAHLDGSGLISAQEPSIPKSPSNPELDLAEVKSQHHAKRALEIAAAGGHNLLMVGPPGTGKTMLATRLPGILPEMSEEEALETAAIASISHHRFHPESWKQRPFRAPHHTASGVALVGGGSHPRPGEISLAHNGVLFLDELPEFDRRVLEVLRQPLETGNITVSRAARQICFPARVQLVAAMNPCPCGYLGEPSGRCHCTAEQVRRYRARVSGPLLDRIDMHIEVPAVPREILQNDPAETESTVSVRNRVHRARQLQIKRGGKSNCQLNNKEINRYCKLSQGDKQLINTAIDRFDLSARSVHRILKVARTVADLEESNVIQTPHLSEAIAYRCLDRHNP